LDKGVTKLQRLSAGMSFSERDDDTTLATMPVN